MMPLGAEERELSKERKAGPEVDLPVQQFLTYRLSRVQAKLNAQASALLRRYAGLTLVQWRVIALIGAAGETRPSDLTRTATLDKGQLSRSLKQLVEDGYVASRTDESDHRAHLLKLTAKGREVFDSTLPKMRERQRRLRAELSEQDLAALHRAFDALELAADWRDDEGEG